jgi:hypothetical protein
MTLCALAAGAWTLAPPALAQPSDTNCSLQDDSKDKPLLCKERGAKTSLARGDAEIASISPEWPGMTDKEAAKRADDEKESITKAIKLWLTAKDEGLGSGAQASLTAQRRIKMYSLTCVIADNTSNVLHSPLTDIRIQQRALNALGYYQGPYDGQLSVATRIAIRRFQNAMAWVDSGELSSRQIVYLICNGAETARDAPSSTRLALMYTAGVGVERLPSYALGFFKQAEPRDLDAKYYLAALSGTGAGKCEFPINYDRADQRLKEAAEQKHLVAQILQIHYPPLLDQEARWRRIASDLEFRKSLRLLEKDCALPPLPPRPMTPVSPVQLAPPPPPPPAP